MVNHEIEILLDDLRSDDPPIDPDVKKRVISELRVKDRTLVVAALTNRLRDGDGEYRCTIASVFFKLDFAAAMQEVPTLLQDSDMGVQGFICMELGRHRRREAVPHLIEVLSGDPEGNHRVWAAWGLGNIGDPAALPALRAAMQNDDGVDYEGRPVKEIAAEAIRRITQEKATASVA